MTDIRQAVRELRKALNKKEGACWFHAPTRREYCGNCKHPTGDPIVELLPAVLDRLEELERENTMLKLAEKPVYSRRKLTAERDAIRAKFLELREAVDRYAGQYHDRPESALQSVLDRFPALASSGDETEDGREG